MFLKAYDTLSHSKNIFKWLHSTSTRDSITTSVLVQEDFFSCGLRLPSAQKYWGSHRVLEGRCSDPPPTNKLPARKYDSTQQAEDYAMKACRSETNFYPSETLGRLGRNDKRDTMTSSNLTQKASLFLWTWDFPPTTRDILASTVYW